MRVLLDESLPRKFGFLLEGHFVRTVQSAGFAGLGNGNLLRAAANDGFEVLITGDQNMSYQQNANLLPMCVLVLKSSSNKLEGLMPLLPQVLDFLRQPLRAGFFILETQ